MGLQGSLYRKEVPHNLSVFLIWRLRQSNNLLLPQLTGNTANHACVLPFFGNIFSGRGVRTCHVRSFFTHWCRCISLLFTCKFKQNNPAVIPRIDSNWRQNANVVEVFVCMRVGQTHACIRRPYISMGACMSAGLCTHYMHLYLTFEVCISECLSDYLSILSECQSTTVSNWSPSYSSCVRLSWLFVDPIPFSLHR